MLKIITDKDKIYNALDTTYKKLGAKHITLLEVHRKTLEELSDLESLHHDLKEEMKVHVERFVDLKILASNYKAENKRLKGLANKQRLEFVNDLKEYDQKIPKTYSIELIKKWEACKE